jgi:hypothetical protein
VIVGQCFVGDARRAGVQQPFGQSAIRRQVEISKHHLPFADFFDLDLLRLLHLHDQVGPGEDFVGPFDQLGARLLIFMIRQPRTCAGPGFDEHLVFAPRQLFHTDGQHGHAILVLLDLLRHTHDHEKTPSSGTSRACRIRNMMESHQFK